MKIRSLRADEIEVRVAQVFDGKVRLLLYKDSRCDKRILDETYTPLGWQDKYETINDVLYCTVSVWDEEKKQWVSKQDCGTESNTEAKKGEASDAFKRACFNWGIGRELYTKIPIFVNVPTKVVLKGGKNTYQLAKTVGFYVSEVKTDPLTEKITKITLCDNYDRMVFNWEAKAEGAEKQATKNFQKDMDSAEPIITKTTLEKLNTLIAEMNKSPEQVARAYKAKALSEITEKQGQHAIKLCEDCLRKEKC